MQDFSEIVASVRATANERMLFLPHAVRQMSRPDRMIITAYLPDQGQWSEDFTTRVRE